MNQESYDAIEEAWKLTIKTRALCPSADSSAVGLSSYSSPSWYENHGAVYLVKPAKELTEEDIKQLNQIGDFVNRSFVITMAAILETHNVVPYRHDPDINSPGGKHVQLTKWLRNRFAHGEWTYDSSKQTHVETRQLIEELFPNEASGSQGFVISIDTILEPLKDGILVYIRATT